MTEVQADSLKMLTTEIQFYLPFWYCGIGIALHIVYQKTNIEVQALNSVIYKTNINKYYT